MAARTIDNDPSRVSFALKKLGAEIADARKSRKISAQSLADQINISRPTLKKIEKGETGVAFGTYAAVVFSLGIADRMGEVFSSVGQKQESTRSEYRSLVWANPQADDSIFIRAALQKPKIIVLADIVRDYGLERVMKEWEALKETIVGRKVAMDVTRMLKHLTS